MKRLIPVIHVENKEQAAINAHICNVLGLGCFLIHHRKNYKHLFEAAEFVHERFPGLWIGLNSLDLATDDAFEKVPEWVNAVWADDGGVVEINDTFHTRNLRKNYIAYEKRGLNFEYFGSYAFKYQAPIYNIKEGAMLAAMYMDVVTTSGEGTGIAADIEKIKKIKEGVGVRSRLGIASGITSENVLDYLPYVDDFLVATGISCDANNLDIAKVAELKEKIEKYDLHSRTN